MHEVVNCILVIIGDIQLDSEVQDKHLGEIADQMSEWEGQIADKLDLKECDVAGIKIKYPQKLNLQT